MSCDIQYFNVPHLNLLQCAHMIREIQVITCLPPMKSVKFLSPNTELYLLCIVTFFQTFHLENERIHQQQVPASHHCKEEDIFGKVSLFLFFVFSQNSSINIIYLIFQWYIDIFYIFVKWYFFQICMDFF